MFHRKWRLVVAICAVVLPIATGCGKTEQGNVPTNNNFYLSSHGNKTSDLGNNNNSTGTSHATPKSINNVILAKTHIPGFSGQQLELVDVKGQYINNTVAGPFQGNNWTGQFQLRVVNSKGKVKFKLSLPDNKFTQLLFMNKFQFQFADYNGNGYPDFTLGQYRDSNGDVFQLYEVKPGGIIPLQTKPAQLFVSAAPSTYSLLFHQVKPSGFEIKYYDNAKDQWYQVTYYWKHHEFQQGSIRAVSSS